MFWPLHGQGGARPIAISNSPRRVTCPSRPGADPPPGLLGSREYCLLGCGRIERTALGTACPIGAWVPQQPRAFLGDSACGGLAVGIVAGQAGNAVGRFSIHDGPLSSDLTCQVGYAPQRP